MNRNMARVAKRIALVATVVGLAIAPALRQASAQAPASAASAENEPMELDFSPRNPHRKVRFPPDGLAYELEIEFLLRTAKRELRANLPEPGRFEVVLDPRCEFVHCGEPQFTGREVRVELLTKLPALTPEALDAQIAEVVAKVLAAPLEKATAEANRKTKAELAAYFAGLGLRPPGDEAKLKQQYAARRARSLGTVELLAALKELAQRRPQWVPASDQQLWNGLKGPQLYEIYERLLKLDIGEEYLRACGLTLDTSKRGFDALILARLEGVHAIRGGGLGAGEDGAKLNARALPPEEASRLRRAFTFSAVCRFVPPTDPDDPNSSWLGAQRVSCRFDGVASRVVSGRLDANKHDATDWWTLQDYDPRRVSLRFRGGEQVSHEVFPDGRRARLRVTSQSDQSLVYTFELAPVGGEAVGPVLQVEESSASAGSKFPF